MMWLGFPAMKHEDAADALSARMERGLGAIMPLVGRLLSLTGARISRACAGAGYALTPEEAGALMVLFDCDGLPQSHLARILGKDKAAVTRLMNALVRSGLVERVQDARDRRIVRAFVTREGRAAFARLMPELERISAEALRGVDAAALEGVRSTLARIVANLGGGEDCCGDGVSGRTRP